MVAAHWGETRDPDARTGGGVSGRFRLLGRFAVPDTTPPPFGTAPWGYRRSEVDAWASWVAGLVAHGRNETIRADSAEATLKATLERLEQCERPGAPGTPPPESVSARQADGVDASGQDDGASQPEESTVDATSVFDGPGARTGGLHDDPPADLPRRVARDGVGASAPDAPTCAGEPPDPGTPDPATAPDAPPTDGEPPDDGAPDAGSPAPATGATRTEAAASGAAPGPRPHDHDLARLHVVETTLHEVLELLHHLADRERRPAGS
ncbi:MAG: hypothetical protein M3235_16780 [Actinomycetota bacterium]|nr:hypothetical protein [Actinomycetota bacterium]